MSNHRVKKKSKCIKNNVIILCGSTFMSLLGTPTKTQLLVYIWFNVQLSVFIHEGAVPTSVKNYEGTVPLYRYNFTVRY